MLNAKIIPPSGMYRLTLTAEAFALAVLKSKPIAGVAAASRPDGKWDVIVSMATANQLRQQGEPKENLSDVVVRLLKKGGA